MDRTERIREMEGLMDRASAAVKDMDRALADFEAVRESVEALERYYASDEWMEDFEADEAGELPGDLKRGVLSEDGLFELLDEDKQLFVRMLKLCARYLSGQ